MTEKVRTRSRVKRAVTVEGWTFGENGAARATKFTASKTLCRRVSDYIVSLRNDGDLYVSLYEGGDAPRETTGNSVRVVIPCAVVEELHRRGVVRKKST